MEENRAHKTRTRTSPSSRSTSSSASSSSKTTKTSSSSSSTSSSPSSRNQGRFRRPWEEGEETEDCTIECTGKSCQACSATLVADCVALCCCPLALVSLLALTFIKVPYVMGRKCLRRRKRREKEKRKAVKDGSRLHFEGNGDIVFEFGEEGELFEQRKSLCTGLIELDNVLLELYQVGHLGFGRVSFTGIQPNVKGI